MTNTRMWRGPLLFALMMVAFAALVGPPRPSVDYPGPNQSRTSEIPEGVPRLTLPSSQAVDPPLYKQPCRYTAEDRQSDLCAQWTSADWTKWGVLVAIFGTIALIYQIKLTRGALNETGKATAAMNTANDLAARDQRAWLSLTATPKLARHLGDDRLYLRVDFVAKNVGKTPATHFRPRGAVFFMGPGETTDMVEDEMRAKVEEWKQKYSASVSEILPPNDAERSPIWESFEKTFVKWDTSAFREDRANPILLFAVFYRTVANPDVVQLSWRTWYIVKIAENGQPLSYIPKHDDDLGPSDLHAETFLTHLFHEEFAAKDDA